MNAKYAYIISALMAINELYYEIKLEGENTFIQHHYYIVATYDTTNLLKVKKMSKLYLQIIHN